MVKRLALSTLEKYERRDIEEPEKCWQISFS